MPSRARSSPCSLACRSCGRIRRSAVSTGTRSRGTASPGTVWRGIPSPGTRSPSTEPAAQRDAQRVRRRYAPSARGGYVGAKASNGGTRREGILLVDDDRILVALLAVLAEQAGFTPLVAQDPKAAIEQFEKHDPVLAVIDLNLDPWDGFDLLADLRRRTPAMPILVLTARIDEDDKVRALDLEAD